MQDVSFVSSTVATIKHGFFMRHGGVSSGQFSTLNATSRVGDSEDNAQENRRRACETGGFDNSKLVFLDFLPHGDESAIATNNEAGSILNEKDAIITTQKGLPIMIAVADCNPVLITDNQNFVTLVHSGWRGTKANIIGKTITTIKEQYGYEPKNMVAVIGPSISPDDYPVQREVAQFFDDKYLRAHGKHGILLDLWTAAEDQLKEAGVKTIKNLKINTYNNPDFFSYREDKGDTGRFMAIAQL